MKTLHLRLAAACALLSLGAVAGAGSVANKPHAQSLDPTEFFRADALRESFDKQITFDQYISYAMRAISMVAGPDTDLHRYDDKRDLINSFERNLSYTDDLSKLRAHIDPSETELLADQPELVVLENERNQVECGERLEALTEAAGQLFRNFSSFSNSKELALIDMVDSFGSPQSLTTLGNNLWSGSFKQCQRATLMPTRYCLANFKSPNWDSNDPKQTLKVAVCLPKACNSISYLRHRQRIETLVKLVRLNQVPWSQYNMSQLYCVPDDHSPLRQLSWSAQLFLVVLASWLLLVLYHSLKYEFLRMSWLIHNDNTQKLDKEIDKLTNIMAFRLSWRKLFELEQVKQPKETNTKTTSTSITTISVTNNYQRDKKEKALFSPKLFSPASSPSNSNSDSETNDDTDFKHREVKAANILEAINSANLSLRASLRQPQQHTQVSLAGGHQAEGKSMPPSLSSSPPPPQVDLSVVEGIKVISMIWLIMAHALLFFMRYIANGRDFWSILKDARFVTIMAGIFPVDTFFTITGILAAHVKFNKNHGAAMLKVKYWLETFLHRYLRFMPLYLLIFWYTRDVSEYIGQGPMWDYATSNTSLRAVCKQESFSVPLLFQANFKRIDEHCVKPAWYLANDYQFLLITPIFMLLLMKSTWLGYGVIGLSIVGSLIMQFSTVFYSDDVDDFGVLINFKPMFASYVLLNLWKLYGLPYNRLPPYLIGLATGHMMYRLNNEAKKNHNKTKEKKIKYNHSQDSLISQSNCDLNGGGGGGDGDDNNNKPTTETVSNDPKKSNRSTSGYLSAIYNYLCVKIWIPIVFLISIIYLPLVTQLATQEGWLAKIGTSSIMAVMRLVWSLAIARLIFVCATRGLKNFNGLDNGTSTREGNDSFLIRFLTSTKWKPWSKIGLSALLIQWEIITYLVQSQSGLPEITITYLMANILLCILATYSLALLMYLTLEYPLSQVEQVFIRSAIFNKT